VGSSPNEVDLFNLPNPSSHIMALWSTPPLTEMSARNLPGGGGGGVKGSLPIGLTTMPPSVSQLPIEKMLEPRCLTTLWAFTASYKNSFIFSCLLLTPYARRNNLGLLVKRV
jgi:hypothetical protein